MFDIDRAARIIFEGMNGSGAWWLGSADVLGLLSLWVLKQDNVRRGLHNTLDLPKV